MIIYYISDTIRVCIYHICANIICWRKEVKIMLDIVKNMQFSDPDDGSKLRVTDSTFKSLRPVGGQDVHGITLEDIESGEELKYTFEDFSKFIPDKSYDLIGFVADLVLKDGSVEEANMYIRADILEREEYRTVIHVEGDLLLSSDIDYVILKYISEVRYDRELTVEVTVSGIYDMYSSISGYNVDDSEDINYHSFLTNSITERGVLIRNIYNPLIADYIPTYKDVVYNAFDYKWYITISQAFTPWGVIPIMCITKGQTQDDLQVYTVFENRLFPITDTSNIYNITETRLCVSTNNENEIGAAAELGIRMFDEWAYDYSFFIEPIRKHFAK